MALVKLGKRHTLFYGGSRSGKTFLIVFCIVLRALKYPGSRHLIYRLQLKNAIQSIWLETLPKVVAQFDGLAQVIKTNESRYVMTFPNGAEIWVAGVDDDRSEDSVLGKEYVTVYANEASQIPYMTAWKVRTRLAQKIEGCVNREFVDLNPTTRAHWTAREFVDKIDPINCKPGNRKTIVDPEEFVYYQLNPAGNKQNLDQFYIRSLENAPESMRRRFYEGEYSEDDGLLVFPFPPEGFFVGRMFEEWVKQVGPGNVRFVAGLDLGFNDADGFVIIAYVPRLNNEREKPADEKFAERYGRFEPEAPKEGIDKSWLIYEYKARRTGLEACANAIKAGLDWAEKKARELDMSSANMMIYSDTGGGGAKMVYDLRTVYKLPVLQAYKRDKKAAIEMLQDEVRSALFMVPADGEFAQEAQSIVWVKDPETGVTVREIDDRQFHPDIMDSVLYAKRAVWMATLGR